MAGAVGPGSPGNRHAPVSAPVNGSKHGAQRSSSAQKERGNSGCAATSGRHLGKQRPSTAEMELQLLAAAPLVNACGVQSCAAWQSSWASRSRCIAGTCSLGKQCPLPPQQSWKTCAACFGPESPGKLQAPVALPESGSKQGAQRSCSPQLARGKRPSCAATSGRQLGRHRPSTPALLLQAAGAL